MTAKERAIEIFKAAYNKNNMHWYYTYERDLMKVHELLEHLEDQMTPHGDHGCSDPCDVMYMYRDAVAKKLMDALADFNINHGRVYYYTAILVYLRRYHAVCGEILRKTNNKES